MCIILLGHFSFKVEINVPLEDSGLKQFEAIIKQSGIPVKMKNE